MNFDSVAPILTNLNEKNYARGRRAFDSYIRPVLQQFNRWLVESVETTNYTYDLTPINLRQLQSILSIITGVPRVQIEHYCAELLQNYDLIEYYNNLGKVQERKVDTVPRFGRRIGWYVCVRVLKPKVVVETGVDHGLGSLVITSALKNNALEGFDGRYIGTDINPNAGELLKLPYSEYGRIVVGDSIQTLRKMDCEIDVFINDSDHSAAYERGEYDTVEEKLSPSAIVLGDNAHVTDELQVFAERSNRTYLFWAEKPVAHWYPGAGIGFAFVEKGLSLRPQDPAVAT